MISNELLEEIIYLSSKDKYISKELMLNIILNVIDKLDNSARSKFNDVVFSKINLKWCAASWSNETGIMELDYRTIIKDCKYLGEGNILTSNLLALIYPLHEIQHMNENYKITTNTLESDLIKLGTIESIYSLFKEKYSENKANKQYVKFINQYSDIMPTEKIAEVDAYRTLLDSLKNYPEFPINYIDSYEDLIYEYFCSLIIGYNDFYTNTPVSDYLSRLREIGYEEKIIDENLISKLNSISSIEDRLKYGAKVSNEEVENVRQKILKI